MLRLVSASHIWKAHGSGLLMSYTEGLNAAVDLGLANKPLAKLTNLPVSYRRAGELYHLGTLEDTAFSYRWKRRSSRMRSGGQLMAGLLSSTSLRPASPEQLKITRLL